MSTVVSTATSSATPTPLTHTLEFKIPFENEKQSIIAKNSLSPDPLLKPDELKVSFSNDGNVLKITFRGTSDRMIRVAANNIMDNLKTVLECFEVFD
ncbi:DEKNAAC100597 [Brettanomyces naardenensis]|uniref:DEKNAAC100598 n=1 Tax=Brettanomyces naardenensis TaxID=13370 RepID=A0A448YGK6_BRENA|nr:DEKNAAC100597 [Brettanomyces naardenensis]